MFSFLNKIPFFNRSSSMIGGSFSDSFSFGTISIICIILLFLVISLIYYYKVLKPKMKPSYRANQELGPKGLGLGTSGANGGKEAELMFFYTDWCPHCKTAKPEWQNLKQEYQGKTINGYSIIFTDVNCTNESPEVERMMNTYKIEGYPTIKLVKDGQVVEYDAKPTKATLVQFLNSVL